MNARDEKAFVRKEFLLKRESLEDAYASKAAADICKSIILLPEFTDAKLILAYSPVNGETDITEAVMYALGSGKTVGFPKCFGKGMMSFFRVSSFSELAPGRYGIPEPSPECGLISDCNGALCIVPAVAASCDGRHIGYGGGYYDRFLPRFHMTSVCTVFEAQLASDGALPFGIFDTKFDILVTERRTVHV